MRPLDKDGTENALEAQDVVVLRVLEREEQARLDEIAWAILRPQLYPVLAIAILKELL